MYVGMECWAWAMYTHVYVHVHVYTCTCTCSYVDTITSRQSPQTSWNHYMNSHVHVVTCQAIIHVHVTAACSLTSFIWVVILCTFMHMYTCITMISLWHETCLSYTGAISLRAQCCTTGNQVYRTDQFGVKINVASIIQIVTRKWQTRQCVIRI